MIQKKEKGSFCLIHHLSAPKGDSLNNQISEDALVKLRGLGQGALMAKAVIQSAFRLLPINPLSLNSLGFVFYGYFFFDRCLPMGCSLSCTYFKAFATFLEWVVR